MTSSPGALLTELPRPTQRVHIPHMEIDLNTELENTRPYQTTMIDEKIGSVATCNSIEGEKRARFHESGVNCSSGTYSDSVSYGRNFALEVEY